MPRPNLSNPSDNLPLAPGSASGHQGAYDEAGDQAGFASGHDSDPVSDHKSGHEDLVELKPVEDCRPASGDVEGFIDIEPVGAGGDGSDAQRARGYWTQVDSSRNEYAGNEDAGEAFAGEEYAGEAFPDVIDSVLIGRLAARHLQVEAGDAAALSISLLYNGEREEFPADQSEPGVLVTLHVDGWVDELWFPDLPQEIWLEPGVWTTLSLAITPPLASHSWAGDHPFALVLRSPQHPQRFTRLGAVLTIAPFADFLVSALTPDFVESKRRLRAGSTRFQVTNRGNAPARYRVWGTTATYDQTRMFGGQGYRHSGRGVGAGRCDFRFRAGPGETPHSHPVAQEWLDLGLEPGETRAVGCRIEWNGMPPLGPFARTVPFRLVVEPLATAPRDGEPSPVETYGPRLNEGDGLYEDAARTEPASRVESDPVGRGDGYAPRVLAGKYHQRPLVGVWALTALLSVMLGGFIFMGILGVMAFVLLQNGGTRSQTAAEPPVVAIMLHMDELLVPRAAAPAVTSDGAVGGGVSVIAGAQFPTGMSGASLAESAARALAEGDVPQVQAGDVTAPGVAAAGAGPAMVTGAQPALQINPIAEGQNPNVTGLAMVDASQVTAPGATLPRPASETIQAPADPPLPAPQGGIDPARARAAGPPVAGPRMTYAQMFQDVGLRYDLDWRMLAAQAYIESGFDALALGNRGSMGLMQIQPQTWREWAPVIGAVDPFDSYSSALVAGIYLDYLRRLLDARGYPQTEWMLVAYNWGPDQLLGFLGGGGQWSTLPAQVRGYAEDVLRIAQTLPALD